MRIEGCLEKEITLISPITVDKKTFSKIVIREAIGTDCELASVEQLNRDATGVMCGIVHQVIAEVPSSSRLPNLEEVKALPTTALENILLEVSRLSAGEKYSAVFKCKGTKDEKPCTHTHTEEIIKGTLLETKKLQNSGVCILERGIHKGDKVLKTVKFRTVDSNAQGNVLKERKSGKFVTVNSQLMYDCVVDVDGEEIDFSDISRMTAIDRKKLSEAIQASITEPKTTLKRVCPICGEEIIHYVNILDFLV